MNDGTEGCKKLLNYQIEQRESLYSSNSVVHSTVKTILQYVDDLARQCATTQLNSLKEQQTVLKTNINLLKDTVRNEYKALEKLRKEKTKLEEELKELKDVCGSLKRETGEPRIAKTAAAEAFHQQETIVIERKIEADDLIEQVRRLREEKSSLEASVSNFKIAEQSAMTQVRGDMALYLKIQEVQKAQ